MNGGRRRIARVPLIGIIFAMLGGGVVTVAASALVTVNTAAPDAPAPGPRFDVDPGWPKPLSKRWLMGQAAGVAVDRHDVIWVIHRPGSLTDDEKGASLTPPRSACCVPAPPVLAFDAEGNLLHAWGGSADAWPSSEHGIHVDAQDHVWIAGNGRRDGQVFKLTRAGKLVLTIGAAGVQGDDGDTKHLRR
jgi:hypothetical protein